MARITFVAAMARAYEGLPGFLSMFPPTIDGDGMVMGAELGAQTRTIRNNLAVFLGFNIPGKHPDEEPPGVCIKLCGLRVGPG